MLTEVLLIALKSMEKVIKKSTHKYCGRLTLYYLIKLSYKIYKIYTTGLISQPHPSLDLYLIIPPGPQWYLLGIECTNPVVYILKFMYESLIK